VSKILVIEDDALVRENLLDLLDAEGYTPISAKDGETGVALIYREKPDLVICDILMPRMNGYEVLAKINQEPEFAALPFIFLTAKTSRDDLRKGMELGADDYITKPFTRDDILRAIRLRLSKKEVFRSQVQNRQTQIQTSITRIVPHTILEQVSSILDSANHLVTDDSISDVQAREIGKSIFSSANELLRFINQLVLLSDIEMAHLDETRAKEMRRGEVASAWSTIRDIAMIYAKDLNRLPDLILEGTDAHLALPELYFQALIEELVGGVLRYSHNGQPVEIRAFPDHRNEFYEIHFIEHGRPLTESDIAVLSAEILPDRQSIVANGLSIKPLLVRQLLDFFGGSMKVEHGKEDETILAYRLPILKSV